MHAVSTHCDMFGVGKIAYHRVATAMGSNWSGRQSGSCREGLCLDFDMTRCSIACLMSQCLARLPNIASAPAAISASVSTKFQALDVSWVAYALALAGQAPGPSRQLARSHRRFQPSRCMPSNRFTALCDGYKLPLVQDART